MKTSIAILSTAFFVAAGTTGARAQKAVPVADLINTQDYRFVAQSALPMGRPTRQLTGDYDLVVTKDTVIADLPYFGRAYSAPIGSDAGGIIFTSTKFDYAVTPTKKGGWDIAIKPKDARDVTQLYLHVSSKGYADLRVTSINRQSISFNGEVRKRKRGR
jgi:hypothetical protein